ncbi:MAG TPA: VacJ family lipoprotein, partial [Candidatus Limnocylindrales bacterium]|nr:VacJ family lipoprotein [Candidatus Limnocylindrales bacterium]
MRRRSLILATVWVCLMLLQGYALGADPPLSLPSPDPAVAPPAPAGKEVGEGLTDNSIRSEADVAGEVEDEFEETSEVAPSPALRDPLEPVNRILFVFNDKAYFWVMKPVAQGYRAVVPEAARVSVRNFFSNLATPIRFVNALLQGKFKASGTELLRFTINSTVGIGGLFDVARKDVHLDRRDEDLGQTLGV